MPPENIWNQLNVDIPSFIEITGARLIASIVNDPALAVLDDQEDLGIAFEGFTEISGTEADVETAIAVGEIASQKIIITMILVPDFNAEAVNAGVVIGARDAA